MAEPLDSTDTATADPTTTGPLYRYTVEADGYRYTVETPDDIDQDEVMRRIAPIRGSEMDEAEADQSPETRRRLLGGQEAKISDARKTANLGYGEIVGRRFGESVDAFRGLGVNQYQMVFGGNPEGRAKSAMDYLRGLGSVSSAILSPATAAVEKAGLAAGVDPDIARGIGDISELPVAWLFGGLAAAGKLGGPALNLMTKLGTARPMSLAAQQIHDRHLAYAAGKQEMSLHEKMQLGISPVEEMARMSNQSIAELAIAAKKPTLASVRLKQLKAEGDVWDAKIRNGDYSAAHDIPESPTVVYKPNAKHQGSGAAGKDAAEAEFTPLDRDPVFIVGTSGHAAGKSSPLAEIANHEMQLGELRVMEAKKVHNERIVAGISGYGDDAAREAIAYRANRAKQPSHIKRNVDAEPNLSDSAKAIVKYIDDTIAVLNATWKPRLRAVLRPKIELQVRAELARGTKAWDPDFIKNNEKVIHAEVNKRVKQEIGDDWSVEDHLGELLHGDYSITAKNGTTWRASTPQGLRQIVREIKELHPEIKLDDLTLSGKRVYLDDDLIRELHKGRMHRNIDNLLRDVGEHVKLEDMWNGTKPTGRTNFFRGMLEGKNKGPGYSVDLIKTLNMLHGQTERLLMLSDVERKVGPLIKDLRSRGLHTMANALDRTFDALKGSRSSLGISFDRFVASNPLTRAMGIQTYALERWAGGLRSAVNTGFLKLNVRYQVNNAGFQLLQTLWPITTSRDFARGAQLAASKEGRAILQRHGVFGVQSKFEGEKLFGSAGAGKARQWYEKLTNAGEQLNQETAFLIMYDKARRLGLTDMQAAAYGKLRGQVYTQFLGLTTDVPDFFRRADPFGVLTMFQRYPVKQYEMLSDIIRDKNFPAAAKWLAVNLMMGGAKASTMGNAGWLTHKMYESIKEKYGETVAGLFHSGLPSLIGIDQAASVQLLNPPFGKNLYEKAGRLMFGVVGSTIGSVIGAALETKQPEPYALNRSFNALIQTVPAFREARDIVKLIEGDYDLRTPGGRLKYRADAKDLFKRILGAKPLKESLEDTAIAAFMEVKQRRDHLLDFVAARRGHASGVGVSLGEDVERETQKQLDAWNSMWPEFPIVEIDIKRRAELIATSRQQEQKYLMMKNQPKALQRHPMFDDFRLERIPDGDG